MDEIEIRVVFEMDHPQHGTYRDALIIPKAEYESMTSADVEAMKQERFNRWVDSIENPVAVVTPDEPTDTDAALDEAMEALAKAQDAVRVAKDKSEKGEGE